MLSSGVVLFACPVGTCTVVDPPGPVVVVVVCIVSSVSLNVLND